MQVTISDKFVDLVQASAKKAGMDIDDWINGLIENHYIDKRAQARTSSEQHSERACSDFEAVE